MNWRARAMTEGDRMYVFELIHPHTVMLYNITTPKV